MTCMDRIKKSILTYKPGIVSQLEYEKKQNSPPAQSQPFAAACVRKSLLWFLQSAVSCLLYGQTPTPFMHVMC